MDSWLNEREINKSSIIAMGDSSANTTGIKHDYVPAPVKLLKQKLKERSLKVVSIDEYMTSQVCSQCHSQLKSMRTDKKKYKQLTEEEEKKAERNTSYKKKFTPQENLLKRALYKEKML